MHAWMETVFNQKLAPLRGELRPKPLSYFESVIYLEKERNANCKFMNSCSSLNPCI